MLKQKTFSGITDRKLLEKKHELGKKLPPITPESFSGRRPLLSTVSSANKNRWFCRLCKKFLCSKRSYTEHMNTHTRSRPFACEHCPYAAASQMTLRRHVLRNHTSREDWGYQCPYCQDSFMEPSSYQHHAMTKHFGRSATFGCTAMICEFKTLSSKHFRYHIMKHKQREQQIADIVTSSGEQVIRQRDSQFDNAETVSLNRYLVDDEIGNGFGSVPIRLPAPPRSYKPLPLPEDIRAEWISNYEKTARKFDLPKMNVTTGKKAKSAKRKGRKKSEDDDVFVDVDSLDEEPTADTGIENDKVKKLGADDRLVVLGQEEHLSIEAEIVVDGTEEGIRKAAQPKQHKLPDGQVEFDLD